jgi:hypothetical protein
MLLCRAVSPQIRYLLLSDIRRFLGYLGTRQNPGPPLVALIVRMFESPMAVTQDSALQK